MDIYVAQPIPHMVEALGALQFGLEITVNDGKLLELTFMVYTTSHITSKKYPDFLGDPVFATLTFLSKSCKALLALGCEE